jgi:DNA-binding NarL/FixJ family response regulator
MINIVVNEEDEFFKHGLELLIEDVFKNTGKRVIIREVLDEESIRQADVIVMNFVTGSTTICHPALRQRKDQSMIIGVYSGEKDPYYAALPACNWSTIFINRLESVDVIKEKIAYMYKHINDASKLIIKKDCFDCPCRTLSLQQLKVISYIYRGNSVAQIAERLNISEKTVSSHKYQMMRKFNLSNDYELFVFLKMLKEQNVILNIFRESLNINH